MNSVWRKGRQVQVAGNRSNFMEKAVRRQPIPIQIHAGRGLATGPANPRRDSSARFARILPGHGLRSRTLVERWGRRPADHDPPLSAQSLGAQRRARAQARCRGLSVPERHRADPRRPDGRLGRLPGAAGLRKTRYQRRPNRGRALRVCRRRVERRLRWQREAGSSVEA